MARGKTVQTPSHAEGTAYAKDRRRGHAGTGRARGHCREHMMEGGKNGWKEEKCTFKILFQQQ